MGSEVLPLLITGGTGKIGRLLRGAWPWAMRAGLRPIWQARREVRGCVTWDILHEPCPPGLASGIVLALAGGRSDLPANVTLTLAALEAAAAQGARHVFLASSSTVYTPGPGLSEDMPVAPASPYGEAKAEMEAAAFAWARGRSGGPGITSLRIGNVLGADALIAGAARPVVLDPAPGGRGPVRSYIGPLTLAAVFGRLATMAAAGEPLPAVLNVAAPKPVALADLLDAAGLAWSFGAEHPGIVPQKTFDTARLRALQRLPPQASQPAGMIAEWRQLGGVP